jgi:aspartate kinase
MKFGGTSIGTVDGMKQSVQLVKTRVSAGDELIVVVSALSGVTDEIGHVATKTASTGDLKTVEEVVDTITARHTEATKRVVRDQVILERALKDIDAQVVDFEKVLLSIAHLRELTPKTQDQILSFGERLSSAVFSAALRDAGIQASWFTGCDAGIFTDDHFGQAVPLMELTRLRVKGKLLPVLNDGVVPVVTGYIACTQDGVITTLGRGGSDYTATILGSILDANEIWIWTDVDGLMTADPKVVQQAKTIPNLSYAEAMEMAYFGAKGMHPRALIAAAEKQILVRIRNTFKPEVQGTIILADSIETRKVAKSVAIIPDVALVTVGCAGLAGTPGVAAQVFGILGENVINVLMISQGSSEANISFIIPEADLDRAINTLELALLGGGVVQGITPEKGVCVIAVVGSGMKGTPGVAARVFRAVAEKKVNVRMIAQGSSELNISFVVKREDGVNAVKALHDEFDLATVQAPNVP